MKYDDDVIELIERRLSGEAVDLPLSGDDDGAAPDVVARILRTASVQEALGAGAARKAEDFEGVSLSITDVTFRESDYGDGVGLYVLIECFPAGAEVPVTISCGAANVVAQCLVAVREGDLPFVAKLRKSDRPTKAGYYVWWLVGV